MYVCSWCVNAITVTKVVSCTPLLLLLRQWLCASVLFGWRNAHTHTRLMLCVWGGGTCGRQGGAWRAHTCARKPQQQCGGSGDATRRDRRTCATESGAKQTPNTTLCAPQWKATNIPKICSPYIQSPPFPCDLLLFVLRKSADLSVGFEQSSTSHSHAVNQVLPLSIVLLCETNKI